MRTKRSLANIFYGIFSQIITLGLGIVIPRLFLVNFGSEVNGVVNSVGQVFACIGLLEAGIGGVTTQALYKTVANNDHDSSNRILSAAAKYYRKMGIWYIVAVVVMALVYPTIIVTSVPKLTVFLIILFSGMGGAINFFLQYKYTVFLNADGKNYVLTNINMVLHVIISLIKVVLLICGFNVIAVQAAQFFITLLRISIIKIYVRKEYAWIDFEAEPDYSALLQRNAQLIHQVAYLIFSNTDVLVLTFVTRDLSLVSVYTIYNMLMGVLEGVLSSVNNGLTFAFGQIYTEDKEKYKEYFDCYEVGYMAIAFSTFIVTAHYMIPFLTLYTRGISDVNYLDSTLMILFVVMKLFVVMRTQCYTAIIISGNFKTTQNSAIIEAIINLVMTLILVVEIGIYGVILGTIAGLLYRNTYCIVFANKKVLGRSPWITIRRWGINMVIFIASIMLLKSVHIFEATYISMLSSACVMFVGVAACVMFVNYAVERTVFRNTLDIVKQVCSGHKR